MLFTPEIMDTNERNEREDYKFGDDTKSAMGITVPLWAVVSISLFVISTTLWFANTLNGINVKLDKATSDRWHRSEMRSWGYQLWKDNPSIKVPDADDIASKIREN